MAQEHESKTQFTADNYGITTCPADEWATVITCDKSKELHHRKVPDYRELLKLELARHGERAGQAEPRADDADGGADSQSAALLTDVEIIAIVLYTGPMVRPPLQLRGSLRRARSEMRPQRKRPVPSR